MDASYGRRILAPLLTLIFASEASAAPNVLNMTSHADIYVSRAIDAVLGPGRVDTTIFVDYDTIASLPGVVSDSTNPTATFFSVGSGATVNHTPYVVINSSYASQYVDADRLYYQTLVRQDSVLSLPLANFHVGTNARQPPSAIAAVSSSADSGNGGTDWGIEFGLSAGYLGQDTTADSWVSAEMAGMLIALKNKHPAWTFFDIKAALRQTASNWASGYNHSTFGYGYVNWAGADSIASTASLYLQPPYMTVSLANNSANIRLFPFRQTRRSHEVVYAVNGAYAWPVKSEYTAADIATSDSTLVYTSNGTDLEPTFTYTPAVTGTVTFIAFTTDGNGEFSRVEEFSSQSISLLALSEAGGGTTDAPIPRWSVTLLGAFLLLTAERQRRAT